MANIVMLNLVVKAQNVRPVKLYKVGSNSSLETILMVRYKQHNKTRPENYGEYSDA
jgi:hypothetical protein